MSLQRNIINTIDGLGLINALICCWVSFIIILHLSPPDMNFLALYLSYILINFSLCYIFGKITVSHPSEDGGFQKKDKRD